VKSVEYKEGQKTNLGAILREYKGIPKKTFFEIEKTRDQAVKNTLCFENSLVIHKDGIRK
jgi:hypothetical protein